MHRGSKLPTHWVWYSYPGKSLLEDASVSALSSIDYITCTECLTWRKKCNKFITAL